MNSCWPRCAGGGRRERSVTDTPEAESPAACVICGQNVAACDLAPELAHVPESTRLTIHAACFQLCVKASRARGEAWARSPRGRWALTVLRVKMFATVIAVGVATVVAAGPIGIALAMRGRRLRRALRSAFLGDSRAIVIVGYRPRHAGAADIEDTFSQSWSKGAGVVFLPVDIDAPLGGTDLPRAAWEHWGTDPKPPRRQSIVVIPKHGGVARLRVGPSRDDVIEARERVARIVEAERRRA